MKNWWSPLNRRLRIVHDVYVRGEVPLFVQSFCVAVATPLLMRLPLSRVESLIERAAAWSRTPANDPHEVAGTVLRMLQTGRPIVRTGCLTRGLSLYYSLRRAGVDVSLAFGLGRVEGGDGFEGHCWLVLDGE